MRQARQEGADSEEGVGCCTFERSAVIKARISRKVLAFEKRLR